MYRIRPLLAISGLAVLTLAPSQAPARETAERTVTIEQALPSGGSLVVENLLGSVSAVPGDSGDAVRVEAHVIAEAKTSEEAAALAGTIRIDRRADGAGTTLHVAYPIDRFDAFRLPKSGVKGGIQRWVAPMLRDSSTVDYGGRTVRVGAERDAAGLAVHLTVTLPYDRSATIQQSVGSIRGRALRGRLRLAVVDGEVAVERCFGALRAEVERGTLRVVAFQGQRLDLSTVRGDIELADVRAESTRLSTDAGTIRGQRVTAEELAIDSASGEVALGAVEPAVVEVETGSGTVDLASHLERMRRGVIRSASGDVTLRVGELAHFDLLAETKSGAVKMLGMSLEAFEPNDGTARWRQGQGGAELRVSAPHGSLTVRPYGKSRLALIAGD